MDAHEVMSMRQTRQSGMATCKAHSRAAQQDGLGLVDQATCLLQRREEGTCRQALLHDSIARSEVVKSTGQARLGRLFEDGAVQPCLLCLRLLNLGRGLCLCNSSALLPSGGLCFLTLLLLSCRSIPLQRGWRRKRLQAGRANGVGLGGHLLCLFPRASLALCRRLCLRGLLGLSPIRQLRSLRLFGFGGSPLSTALSLRLACFLRGNGVGLGGHLLCLLPKASLLLCRRLCLRGLLGLSPIRLLRSLRLIGFGDSPLTAALSLRLACFLRGRGNLRCALLRYILCLCLTRLRNISRFGLLRSLRLCCFCGGFLAAALTLRLARHVSRRGSLRSALLRCILCLCLRRLSNINRFRLLRSLRLCCFCGGFLAAALTLRLVRLVVRRGSLRSALLRCILCLCLGSLCSIN
mmetsp:Transcript_9806/g.30443  ORF Transcript_9806/g.30443 Transcript_9806/m.30443 type:complete len:408 (+) Transcript_9806:111-1334(+)